LVTIILDKATHKTIPVKSLNSVPFYKIRELMAA
jgi:hypothetical protein